MRSLLLLAPLFAACVSASGPTVAPKSGDAAAQGCASTAGTPTAAAASTEDAAEEAEKKAARAAWKKADRAHELAMARLDLQLAEIETAARVRKAEAAAADAARAQEEAERALKVFLELERPRELADAQLDLDRADFRREGDQDELGELTAMYEAEEFAEMTKELVLKRGRKNLEFSQRALELERGKLELLRDETLPRKQRELELELEQARRAVGAAEAELSAARIEAEKKLAGARQELVKLERPLEDDGDDEAQGGKPGGPSGNPGR